MQQLKSQVTTAQQTIDEMADSDQTIVISTTENKLYLTRGGQNVFETLVSTGKGATTVDGGRTMVFDTPIGKFHIVSKEENPVWVPPDWHYQEEARKRGMRVVRLAHGGAIDADTGGTVQKPESGVWGWFSSSGSSRVLKVRNNSVIEVVDGVERELPPGEIITAGGAVVIPPVGTPQRTFDKVLGSYRLNLGDGYAIHGTQNTNQLGRSVSHGCVRVGDAELANLYAMARVGDEVIIY
jgi:lipoprotein-anchoring transpeptidase ErfK/SrfK